MAPEAVDHNTTYFLTCVDKKMLQISDADPEARIFEVYPGSMTQNGQKETEVYICAPKSAIAIKQAH